MTLCVQLGLSLRRGYLTTFLVIRQHDGEPIPQGEVIPGEVKALAALVRPDCADAGPDLLAVLIFARIPAVVEDIGWCVWHGNVS